MFTYGRLSDTLRIDSCVGGETAPARIGEREILSFRNAGRLASFDCWFYELGQGITSKAPLASKSETRNPKFSVANQRWA